MPVPVPSAGLRAAFASALLAVALVAGPSLWHDDDEPPGEGSRVCVGGVGKVVCVPPEEPPAPPSSPGVPDVPGMTGAGPR